MERKIAPSELIINDDNSIFHLHIKPEMLCDNIILVGDPARVDMVASFFDEKTAEVSNREFHTICGIYRGKPIMCVSHGIGADNIDIVVNELDALANIDFAARSVRSATLSSKMNLSANASGSRYGIIRMWWMPMRSSSAGSPLRKCILA